MADRLMMLERKEAALRNMLMCLSLWRVDTKWREFAPPPNGNIGRRSCAVVVPGSMGDDGTDTKLHKNQVVWVAGIDGNCVASILEIIYITTPASQDVKGLITNFVANLNIFTELATCRKYADILANEEIQEALERAVRECRSFDRSLLSDMAMKDGLMEQGGLGSP